MARVKVRWTVEEVHEAVIEIDDADDIPDNVLAEHETNQSHLATTERYVLETEEVE